MDVSCFPVDIGDPEKTGEPCVIAPDEKESETKQIPSKGKLPADASCLPGDIRYQLTLAFCKKHGIRLSGPRLRRPKKKTTKNAAELKAEKAILRQNAADRNPVEGKFGQGKRRYSLGLVMTKLSSTSEYSIMIAFRACCRTIFLAGDGTTRCTMKKINPYIGLAEQSVFRICREDKIRSGCYHLLFYPN